MEGVEFQCGADRTLDRIFVRRCRVEVNLDEDVSSLLPVFTSLQYICQLVLERVGLSSKE